LYLFELFITTKKKKENIKQILNSIGFTFYFAQKISDSVFRNRTKGHFENSSNTDMLLRCTQGFWRNLPQRHQESATGTSHNVCQVLEHDSSHKLALSVFKMTHVSLLAQKLSGWLYCWSHTFTRDPSAHSNMPAGRPTSEPDNQMYFKAVKRSKLVHR
jgi:hypothetical protein